MIRAYLDRLAAELAFYGVRGRAAARVRAEARDHLLELAAEHGDGGAVERFGPAEPLARQVACQLATRRTRRAAWGAFGALALAGFGYLISLLLVDAGGGYADIFGGSNEWVGFAATIGIVLFPQVAFAAGCLAVLRAFRLRGDIASPAAELGVIRRRSAVALGAGALTLGSWAVWAIEFGGAVTTDRAIFVLSAALTVPVAAAAVEVRRSAQPRAVEAGGAGDLFDDLPIARMRPWPFALLFAGLVGAAAVGVGWIVEGDPGGGLVRAAFEVVAVLVCFAALGRLLALRR